MGVTTPFGFHLFQLEPVLPMIEICFLAFGEVLEPSPLLRGLVRRLFYPLFFLPAVFVAEWRTELRFFS